jgi:hypothetical protein
VSDHENTLIVMCLHQLLQEALERAYRLTPAFATRERAIDPQATFTLQT